MPDAMRLISTTTLAAQAYAPILSNIPQNFRDLQVVITGTCGSPQNMAISINSDYTTSNYPTVYLGGDGSTASSGTLNAYVGGIYGSNLTTNTISFFDYSQTDKQKGYMCRLAAPSGATSIIAGRWNNTSAITSLQFNLGPNPFFAGTTISLFGVVA